MNKIKLGKFGESLALKYLEGKNYTIVTNNYYTRDGEIDLICQKNKIIHFVEVKTRTNHNFGWPEEAVDDAKIEKLALTAQHYLDENELDWEWQIDIVSIIINKKTKTARIKYFENIN